MNDMTLTQEDMSEAVRSTAMLADVTVSVWSGEKSDPTIMEKAKIDAGATGNTGRAIKNLLAGADGPLKDARSAYHAVRQQHYALTLPWVADPHAVRLTGPRLLPNMLFERYLSEMSKKRRAAMAALDAFVAQYPDLITAAKTNLGTLANDLDYPSEVEVRGAFRVAFDFEPIPAGAAFRGLPEAMLDKLARGLQTKQQRMLDRATTAMWEAVRERVQNMVERLSVFDGPAPTDPRKNPRLRAAAVENVRELLVLLPGWNVSGSEQGHEIVEDITRMLDGITADTLREDEGKRNVVGQQARAVMQKLSAWGV